jgi:hypothetical protein
VGDLEKTSLDLFMNNRMGTIWHTITILALAVISIISATIKTHSRHQLISLQGIRTQSMESCLLHIISSIMKKETMIIISTARERIVQMWEQTKEDYTSKRI